MENLLLKDPKGRILILEDNFNEELSSPIYKLIIKEKLDSPVSIEFNLTYDDAASISKTIQRLNNKPR